MLFVDYTFTKAGDNIIFDKELAPSDLGITGSEMYKVDTSEQGIVFRKFELEDTVIKLHEIARQLEITDQVDIAKMIRQIADEVSDKIKKVS